MIVLLVVALMARIFVPWKDGVRIGMAGLFFFTSTAHFSSMKHDLAAMNPPPLSGVTFQGRPATVLWLRTPLQILWIAGLWWSTIRRPTPEPAVA